MVYREYEIRVELARTGCMVSLHIHNPERGPLRRREIVKHCEAHKREWLIQLYNAMEESKAFPYDYAGQTVLALIPIKTVHRVLRAAIKHADEKNTRAVFDQLIVPMLQASCGLGQCAP